MKEPNFNSYTIKLIVPLKDTTLTAEDIKGAKVTLTNIQKGYKQEAYMDSTGVIEFYNIEPGFYMPTLVKSSNEGIYTKNINGGLSDDVESLQVFASTVDTLRVVKSFSSAMIIKEFYYSASLTPAGKQYSSDQFVEIYNNSSETIYADGISLIEHESYATEPNYWSYMNDSIVVKMIWSIPGNGTDVPIEPGKSIVLAKDAMNHRDDPNGNPLCPVNLGNAEFEFWVDYNSYDIDFPSPNLIENLFTFRATDVSFHVRGGSAIALVFIALDPNERIDYINNNLVQKVSFIPSTRWYCKIHNNMVIDAVEVVFDEAHSIYKRFPLNLDAGYTYVPSGARSGKCIHRKIQSVVNGRTIYKDTNNSTEDFEKDADPKPWIYD